MGDFSTPEGRRRATFLAGLLYLGIIAGGIFAEAAVRGGVIVGGDAAATAERILANEALYRAGFGVSLVYLAFNLPLLLVFFQLLRRVNQSLSILMAFFFLVATSVETMNVVNHFAALTYLTDGPSATTMAANETAALAYLSLEHFTTGFGVSLVYFGFYFLLLGYLIARSRFLPRVIGLLLMLGGTGYLVNSFALFLAPTLAALLFPWVLLPSLIAELSTALWLLFKGVDERRWSGAPIG